MNDKMCKEVNDWALQTEKKETKQKTYLRIPPKMQNRSTLFFSHYVY